MRRSVQISTAALLAALLAIAPAGAATISINGNGGGTTGDGSVSVDTGSLLGGGSTSTGDTSGNVSVDLGNVTGGSGGGSTDLLDLGGDGTDSSVDVQFADDDGSVAADLFGSDDDEATISLGGVGTGGAGGLDVAETVDNGSVALDLFGDGGDGTGVTSGADGTGGTIIVNGGSGTQVASLDTRAGTRCITPNGNQIATLANRHVYSSSEMSSWAGATQLSIVKINVCPAAQDQLQASLAANSNVSRLQNYVAGNPTLRSGLGSKGYSSGDVIATDKSGNRLIVYVM